MKTNLGRELRQARESYQAQIGREFSEGDVAEALRTLGIPIERKTYSNLETGRTRTIKPEVANGLAKVLPITVRQIVASMGFELSFDGIEDEVAAALLEAYLQATDDRRQIAQLALMPNPGQSNDELLRALRRLAATDRPGRQESRE